MTSLFTKYKYKKAITYFIGITDEIITFFGENSEIHTQQGFPELILEQALLKK